MDLKIDKIPSPNRDEREIPVEFLILHYTAVDLQETLAIFNNPVMGVSSHLVIDRDGCVYEMVNCMNGKAWRAWHAGVSRWNGWEGFNDFSIGIELVNYNGNLQTYTDAQYQALELIVTRLKAEFPTLQDAKRVLGHEQIAGFRGKADPGIKFDWPRFFQTNYPEQPEPDRSSVCPIDLQGALVELKAFEPRERTEKSAFWKTVSTLTEVSVRLIEETKLKSE